MLPSRASNGKGFCREPQFRVDRGSISSPRRLRVQHSSK